MSEEFEALLGLPGPQRYEHFIRTVVSSRRMWGLYGDGWAMSQTPDGRQVFPLWPEREYAELCIAEEWANHEARAIDLDAALEMMIPKLRELDILPGIFFTTEQGSINITLDEFERDLRAELARKP